VEDGAPACPQLTAAASMFLASQALACALGGVAWHCPALCLQVLRLLVQLGAL